MRSGGGVGAGAASFFGIIPAPKWVGQTAFEEYTLRVSKKMMPQGPKTHDEAEASRDMIEMRNRVFQKIETPKEAYDKYVKTGRVSMAHFDEMLDDMADPQAPIQRHFSHLGLAAALKGYVDYATPEERALVQDMMLDKIDSKDPDTMTAKQTEFVKKYLPLALKAEVKHNAKK
jgi:hypothetical protein